jgi:hypothetical protein
MAEKREDGQPSPEELRREANEIEREDEGQAREEGKNPKIVAGQKTPPDPEEAGEARAIREGADGAPRREAEDEP